MNLYEDWNYLFIDSIAIGGEYQILLPQVNKWINLIIKKQDVTEPLSESSIPIFITSTIPKAIDQFLCFDIINDKNEAELLIQFFENVVDLIQAISEYVDKNIIMSITRMFDHSSLIFQKNKYHKIYIKIIERFTQKAAVFNYVLDSLVNDNNLNFGNYFSLIILIYKKIYQFGSTFYSNIDNSDYLSDIFINFVEKNLNSFFFSNNQNREQMQNSFQSLLKLINVSKYGNDRNIPKLFQLFYEALTNKSIEIQKFGSFCLSCLCQNPRQAKKIMNEKSIIDTLISINVQSDVLKELIPFIGLQIDQKIIDIRDLIHFWFFCSDSIELNNNDVTFQIFICALKCTNSLEAVDEFLESIKNDSTFYFNLLSRIIYEFQNINENISIKAANYLLNCSFTNENAQIVLFKLLNKKLNNSIFSAFLSDLSQNVDQEIDANFFCSIIESIINSSTDPVHLFNDENKHIDQILEFIDKNNPHLIRVLFNLHLKTGTKPNRQIIDSMVKFNSETEVWNFLKELLDNNNYQNNKDYQYLFEIAEKQNPENSSDSFLDFLKTLVFKYSKSSFLEKDGYSPANGIQYTFKIIKNQIRGLDLIFHIYQRNKDSSNVLNSKIFLLKVLNCWKSDYSVDFLNVQIQELICKLQSENPIFLSFDESVEPLFLSLQFVFDYINQAEENRDPEDYESPRHLYSEHYITITICMRKFLSSLKKYTIHFDQRKTLKNLRERIAERENEKVENISFRDYASNKYSFSLEKCGITNDSNIDIQLLSYHNISNDHSQIDDQPPSVIFKTNQFADVLFNLMDDNHVSSIDSISWKILQILPTSQTILNEMLDEKDRFSSFFKICQMTKNHLKKLYLIQTLAKKVNIYEYSEIIGDLINIFNDGITKKEIICFLRSNYHGEKIQKAQELSKSLIQYLNHAENNEIIFVTFDVLNNLCQNNEINFDNECLETFETLDESFWDLIADFIMKAAEKSNSYKEVFNFYQLKVTKNIENSKFSLFMIRKMIEELDINHLNLFYKQLIEESQKYLSSIIENLSQVNPNISNNDYLIFSDILNFIYIIIKKFPFLINDLSLSITDLLDVSFGKKSHLIQKSVLQILSIFLNSKKEEYQNIMNDKINEMMNYSLNDWNYNPSIWIRNEPYAGLKNLGQTCFLNSIFQQLYHLFPVRYYIMTFDFDKNEGMKALQDIFIQMSYSSSSVVDTTSFIEKWRGWNSNLLDPNEQQDSVEFLLNLLNSFPEEISKLFKGELTQFISGIDADFEQTKEELIYYLSLTVKDMKDIYSSFEDFIQDQIISEYHTDDDSVIQVKYSQRISKLPPVLVLQFKRFEFNPKRNTRTKINDKFEFPLQLDIKKICLQNENQNDEDFLYDLNGIIIHKGVATGGHYFSYIKKGNEWWCFNDTSVSKEDEKNVLKEAFGMSQSSASVLFYTQKKYSSIKINEKTGNQRFISFSEEFDFINEIENLKPICEQNERFEKGQALFGLDLVDFIQLLDDPITYLLFYVRVLCHSRNSKKANQFISTLKEKIKSKVEKSHDNSILIKCVDYFNENMSEIVNIFLNSYPDIFSTNLTEIIFFCFDYFDKITSKTSSKDDDSFTPNEKTLDFFRKFIDQILENISFYKKIPPMLKLIKNYISIHPREAFNDGWIGKLKSILEAFNENLLKSGKKKFQDSNFDDLFDALNIIQSYLHRTADEIKRIKSKYGQIAMNNYFIHSFE